MSSIIRLRRNDTGSVAPASGILASGELAINTVDGRLYYEQSGSGQVRLIQGRLELRDEGSTIHPTASIINFVGAGVSVALSQSIISNYTESVANITITGGGAAESASWASQSLSSSFALTAQSSSYALTASYALNGGSGNPSISSSWASSSISASYALTASYSLNGPSGSNPLRLVYGFVTPSLASGSTYTGSVDLIQSDAVILEVSCSQPGRYRFYNSASFRAVDLLRAPGVRPGGEHGLVLDLHLTSSANLVWSLSPKAIFSNADTPESTLIYYTITNGGATSEVSCSLTIKGL